MRIDNRFMIVCFSFFLLMMGVFACSQTTQQSNPKTYPKDDQFSKYWYQGQAELSRYELNQVRYGQLRKGNAVLIFVTEDFFADKQVKHEFGPKEESVQSVLKLNFMRHFYTGVYPYYVMTSVFYPVRYHNSHAFKINNSVQEWCGHTFMQLNNRGTKFDLFLRSYFQKEGDQQFELSPAVLEDEIWTMIRINPDLLPIGRIDIIPGMHYLRFQHLAPEAQKAVAEKKDVVNEDKSLALYQISYEGIPRILTIFYNKDFPYQIEGWEESEQSKVSESATKDLPITKAHKTNSILLDYWTKNNVPDSTYRYLLGDQ